MKKRLVSSILVLLMTTAVFSGCKSTTNKTTSDSKASTDFDVTKKTDYTYKFFISTGYQPDTETDTIKKVEDIVGAKLNIISVDGSMMVEKLNLYLASNDMPDWYNSFWNNTALQKGSAKVTEDELKKYTPNIYARTNELFNTFKVDNAKTWDRFKVDGKIAGLPSFWLNGQYPAAITVRQDILDQLGKKMPTTIDEWEDVFKAYKEKYPNKYAISGPFKGLNWQTFNFVLAANGVYYNKFVKDDKGNIVNTLTLPGMRDSLLTLQKWYKAGYINKEFVNIDQTAYFNEWKSGNLLMTEFTSTAEKINGDPTPGSNWDVIKQNVPTAKLIYAPYPTTKNVAKPMAHTNDPIIGSAMCFGKQLQNDPNKLHKLMYVVDTLQFNKEAYNLAQWGTKDVTYTEDADGKKLYTKDYTTKDGLKKAGIGWANPSAAAQADFTNNPDKVKDANIAEFWLKPGAIYSRDKINWTPAADYNGILSDSGEDLKKNNKPLLDEFDTVFASIIMGKDISEYDKWLDKYYKNGGKEMEAQATKIYK